MSTRRWVAGAVVATVAVAAPLVPSPADAAGASVTGLGWWSRNPTSSAPAGGLAVGVAPDGAATVAAVKLDLGDGVSSARIELTEAGGFGAEIAGAVACITGAAWEPVEKGAFEEAPATTCGDEPMVALARDAEAMTWSADLQPLLTDRSGEVAIALIPDARPEAGSIGGATPFEVQWNGPPVVTSTAAAGSTSGASGGPVSPRPASPSPSSSPSSSSSSPSPRPATRPAMPASSTGSLTVTAPPVPTPAVSATTTTVAAVEVASGEATNGAPFALASGATPGGGDPAEKPYAQAVFFLAVSAAAGLVAGFGRRFARR